MPLMSGRPRHARPEALAERDRLERRNALLNGPCVRALGLRGGESVLDVGSGPGIFAREISRAAPGVRVTGIERDEILCREAGRLAADAGADARFVTRAGDAHALPLLPEEWGTFDVALARHVIAHSATPERIVAEMARAVRPGGRVILIEDDHAQLRWHPDVEGLEAVWVAYCRTLARLDLDPWVGRRLPDLLRSAALEPKRTDNLFFGGCAGESRFELVVESLLDLVDGARDDILALGGVDARTLDDVLERLAAWGRRPGAALWYGTCFVEARRPAGAGFTLTP